MTSFRKTITAVAASIALCSQASIAAVAGTTAHAVNPYAVIGAYGSQASAQVLCNNSVATAAVGAAAAAAAQTPAQGCVLPVVDAPPVAPAVEPAAVAVAPSGGIGIWPVLLALGALAGLAALISSDDDDDDDDVPVPVSPA